MTDFNSILNWKLLSGSHDFPGPDGGTCINEAAIVAAGFEYKKVVSAYDCPLCFSRPIAGFAIKLNDSMSYGPRNELLMPFVMRLSGTADKPDIERKRQEYMIIQISRRMISMQLVAWNRYDLARQFAKAETLEDVRGIELVLADPTHTLDYVLDLIIDLAINLASNLDEQRKFWTIATEILHEAIMLGNHGDEIDTELVVARMAKARKPVKEMV